jgi:RNA polymerase sigma factor (sigma-70 family)
MPDPIGDGRVARFETFFEQHYQEISGYVRRRLPESDADDAVGQIFMVAWRRFDRIPVSPQDRLWLFGVARRCVSDSRRSGLRRQRLQARLVQEHVEEPRPSVETGPVHAAMRIAMAGLRPADREVLQLVLWDDLSHAEAAALLGCSVNAFELRVRRAKRRLRDALDLPEGQVRSIEALGVVPAKTWRINPS